jgi:hypothetical protein
MIMGKILLTIIGVLLVVTGGVWTLQGVGYIKGSFMTSTTTWSIIGPVVVIIGLTMAAAGLRGRRAQR